MKICKVIVSCFFAAYLHGEIHVTHEWDPLKVVVIGGINEQSNLHGSSPEKIQNEIDNVVRILKERDIKIYHYNEFKHADMITGCPPLYPRDPLLVLGNCVVECSMKSSGRRVETYVMNTELFAMLVQQGAHYISMPRYAYPDRYHADDCLLEGGNVLINGNELYVGSLSFNKDPNILGCIKKYSWMQKIVACVPYFLKIDQLKWLYMYLQMPIHDSSKRAIEWLQDIFDQQFVVHEIKLETNDFYVDLDQCLALVRPGLGIICREVIAGELPDSIKDWDFIEISRDELVTFAANILSLDEQTVVIDERNERVIHELESRGITVIPVPFSEVGEHFGGLRCFHQALLRKMNELTQHI